MAEDYKIQVFRNTEPGDFKVVQANEFVQALEHGLSPETAAQHAGAPLAELERDPTVQNLLNELRQYTLKPEAERWLVKALAVKEMLTADASRDRINAAKLAAQDPALGFTSEGTSVTINISDEIRKLDPGPLPWQVEEEKP